MADPSDPPHSPLPSAGLSRSLGVFTATTLVVGSMIGSGIFIAPSLMAGYLSAPGVLLLLFTIGGVLTLLGALSYAELCAAFPHAGGQYVFLREAFGPLAGFLYGWTFFLVIQTGTNAAVALAFAKFLGMLGLPVGEQAHALGLAGLRISRAQLVAASLIVLLTLINCRGVRHGALIQNVSTVLKVAAILVLVAGGLAVARGSAPHFRPLWSSLPGPQAAALPFLAAVGVAMSKAFFAYDAWNTVTFAAEEIRDPVRNLPRALVLGTLATTIIYLLLCVVYLILVPLERMAHVPENLIAAEAARALLGPSGQLVVAMGILVSTFGCLNGMILGGGRVLYAMARDGLFFRSSAQVHSAWGTPTIALVIQAIWSVLLALTGSYDALLTYVMFASLGFNALTVVGLLVLRFKGRLGPRTGKTPLVPALYVLGTGFFMVYMMVGDPKDSLVGLGLVLIGLPAYRWFRRKQEAANVPASDKVGR